MLSRTLRLSLMLFLCTTMFFVEVIVGYTVNSLSLVADAFHMLSDILALGVAIYAIQIAKKAGNSTYTYGWQRAEVIGALVNAVFLIALCFTIFIEAIKRFFTKEGTTTASGQDMRLQDTDCMIQRLSDQY